MLSSQQRLSVHTRSSFLTSSSTSSPVPQSPWCPHWGCSCSCPPALWRTHRGPQRSLDWSAPSGHPGWSWCRAGCSPSAASLPWGGPLLWGNEEHKRGETEVNMQRHRHTDKHLLHCWVTLKMLVIKARLSLLQNSARSDIQIKS